MEAPKTSDLKRKQISSTCEKKIKISIDEDTKRKKNNWLTLERKIQLLNDWHDKKIILQMLN